MTLRLMRLVLAGILMAALLAAADNREVAEAAFDELVRQDFGALSKRLARNANLLPEDRAVAVKTLAPLGALRSERLVPRHAVNRVEVEGNPFDDSPMPPEYVDRDTFTFPAEFENGKLDISIAVVNGKLTELRLYRPPPSPLMTKAACGPLPTPGTAAQYLFLRHFAQLADQLKAGGAGKTQRLAALREDCQRTLALPRGDCKTVASVMLEYAAVIEKDLAKIGQVGPNDRMSPFEAQRFSRSSSKAQSDAQDRLRFYMGRQGYARLDQAIRSFMGPDPTTCLDLGRLPSLRLGPEPLQANPR